MGVEGSGIFNLLKQPYVKKAMRAGFELSAGQIGTILIVDGTIKGGVHGVVEIITGSGIIFVSWTKGMKSRQQSVEMYEEYLHQ